MMKQNIKIVNAGRGDAPAIKKIMLESFRQYCDALGIETIAALEEPISVIEEDIATKLVFIARVDGGIVGSVRVKINTDGSAYLSRFGTLLHYQKLGVGTALFAAVDVEMKKLNVEYLELVTASAATGLAEFYTKHGYKEVSRSNDAAYERLLLRKYYKAILEDKA